MDKNAVKDALFGKDGTHAIKDYLDKPNELISSILPTFYIAAGFILFLYLVFGGFTIVSSAGDAKKTEEGGQAITNAIIGFIVIFASYWIIQIVEVITGVPILN